jgi:3-oxoacyl-[acyl-carrier protein] reductase
VLNIDLGGMTAIVTGGSRGIGRQISMSLADAGADVAIIYAFNEKAALEVEKEIKNKGRKALIFKCNVSDEEDVNKTVNRIYSEFGRIDILVNNAGTTRDNLILRLSSEEWDKVLETNLKGAFLVTKYTLKYMLKDRFGRIINISSVAGINGNIGQANYVSSKAGLIGFTKVVAMEYGSRNINANAIAPGFIETEMTKSLSEKIKEEFLKRVANKRIGKPEDVANLVVFLVSPLASYITGSTFVVDGGLSLG